MKIVSNLSGCAIGICAAAAVLAGCNSGASQSSFTPSGTAQHSAVAPESHAPASGGSTQYRIRDLGTLGGNYSTARNIHNRGWLTGASYLKGNKVFHATLWQGRRKVDLGTLGGPYSEVGPGAQNNRGVIAGPSELAQADPYSEDFCLFGDSYICSGFR